MVEGSPGHIWAPVAWSPWWWGRWGETLGRGGCRPGIAGTRASSWCTTAYKPRYNQQLTMLICCCLHWAGAGVPGRLGGLGTAKPRMRPGCRGREWQNSSTIQVTDWRLFDAAVCIELLLHQDCCCWLFPIYNTRRVMSKLSGKTEE